MTEENDFFKPESKLPSPLKKFAFIFLKFRATIVLKENLLILPYTKNTLHKLTEKKINKFFKRIEKACADYKIKAIAISNEIGKMQHIDYLKNLIYSNNLYILTGNELFKSSSPYVLEYISKSSDKPLNEIELSVMTNTTNEYMKNLITLLAPKVKNINIVTSNLTYFKPLAQELYDSFGISVRISNNKKKILTKSHIIFNYDFSEGVLNKYALPFKGILVNFDEKINIHNKLFNGLNIHYFSISVNTNIIEDFKNIYLLKSFPLELIYEGQCYNQLNSTKIFNKFIDDNFIITGLYTHNGKLEEAMYKIL